MSTMPDIVEAVVRAYARRDLDQVKTYLLQAAAKLGGVRGDRMRETLIGAQAQPSNEMRPGTMMYVSRPGANLSRWQLIREPRAPNVPAGISEQLDAWCLEAAHAVDLSEAGERTYPLLLVGPTRCGKTSSASAIARQLGRDSYRLNNAGVVASHMGETASNIRKALDETLWMSGTALFLIDEIDGLVPRRGSDGEAAGKEQNHTVGCLLTWLEELPPNMTLVATTNHLAAVDPAVAARFTVIEWPTWDELDPAERTAFASSHGLGAELAEGLNGYAEAVALGRRTRVAEVIARAAAKVGSGEAA